MNVFPASAPRYANDLLEIFVPLCAQLPRWRDDPAYLEEHVKAVGDTGITDVATVADMEMQRELEKSIAQRFPDWGFWGEEEGKNSFSGERAKYAICDPIEGTNNFKHRIDPYWGSVLGLVDAGNTPLFGAIAQPVKNRVFVGLRGHGAHLIRYGEEGALRIDPIPPVEIDRFTYNNSPHFEQRYKENVSRFFALGDVAAGDSLGRHDVRIGTQNFVDIECGALEPMLYQGGIMFKTNLEMAAVFAILGEIGAKVTDGEGKGWSPSLNSLIFARTEADWQALKEIYDLTSG